MSTSELRYREASLRDFEELYAFWDSVELALYPREHEKALFESMMKLNPDLCVVLVDKDERIVGSVLGSFDGRSAMINRLAVAESLQGMGWGKKLMIKIEELFSKKGVSKVLIQIHSSNTKVLRFYEKLGFQEVFYAQTYFKDYEDHA